mmetsp:Transcript_18280/g.25603  ORF Transcript_18280/g.25603 Transcript_18280/m.25603 type:complete len:407 (+) Transcript_18280:90-1310(+)
MFKGKPSKKKQSKRQNGKKSNTLQFDRNATTIPRLVEDCIVFLDTPTALQTEGIFRLSGSQDEIQKIKTLYEEDKPVDLQKMAKDVNVVAGLLKLYFRELPEALLTYELYECFLAAIGVPEEEAKMDCLRKVIDLLPAGNRLILTRLMGFLHKVAQYETVNKMSPQNLAICFAPTLYRPKEETFDIVMADASHANKLMQTFIVKFNDLFVREKKAVERPAPKKKEGLEEFQKTLRRNTIKLAKSFVEEEAAQEFVATDEEVSVQEQKLVEEDLSKKLDDIVDLNIDDNSNSNNKSTTNTTTDPNLPSLVTPPMHSNTIANGQISASYTSPRSSLMDPSTSKRNSTNGHPKATAAIPPPVEPMTAQDLVKQLMQGKNVLVINYLDTLSVQDRKRTVDEMNKILDEAK